MHSRRLSALTLRLESLLTYTMSRGRYREARLLMRFRISLLDHDPIIEHILTDLLPLLHTNNLELEYLMLSRFLTLLAGK